MLSPEKRVPNPRRTRKLVEALRPLENRLQLAAAMETGCPNKAERLAQMVLWQSARRRGRAGLRANPARKLLRDLRTTAARMRRAGVLA